MPGDIILVRHAATCGGEGRAIGRTPLALSEEGLRQAAALADTLRHIPFGSLYTSPALRAQATLKPLLERTGRTAQIMPELDEINLGEWDGLPFAEIRERYPAAYAERGNDMAKFRPPAQGGVAENFADVDSRMHAALARIAAGPLPALVMSHAGCLRTVLCRCTGTPLADLFRFAPRHAQPFAIRLLAHNEAGVSFTLADPETVLRTHAAPVRNR